MSIAKNPPLRKLYRQLVREAERFPQYNYRMYALRKIKDEFAGRSNLQGTELEHFLQAGQGELERLRRMTAVAALYAKDSLVIEAASRETSSSKPSK